MKQNIFRFLEVSLYGRFELITERQDSVTISVMAVTMASNVANSAIPVGASSQDTTMLKLRTSFAAPQKRAKENM